MMLPRYHWDPITTFGQASDVLAVHARVVYVFTVFASNSDAFDQALLAVVHGVHAAMLT